MKIVSFIEPTQPDVIDAREKRDGDDRDSHGSTRYSEGCATANSSACPRQPVRP